MFSILSRNRHFERGSYLNILELIRRQTMCQDYQLCVVSNFLRQILDLQTSDLLELHFQVFVVQD